MMPLRPCSGFPGSTQASRTSGRTRMPPSSRPGRYLRGSTRKGTQKALLSGRPVCAVLSTRVLNLRRFLRMAIGMGLSPTRCIGCCHQEPFLEEVVANGDSGHSDFGSSSSSNSPEPQEEPCADQVDPWGEALVQMATDYSLLLTFIYDGRVVGEAQVQSLDCRLVAEPSGSQYGMEQVVFPKPGPQEPTQRLLSQLERGVLVASNSRGLFVQRLCPIPISWNAPRTPPGPGPHLLPSNKCVELFRTTHFCRAGPPSQPVQSILWSPALSPGSPPSPAKATEDGLQSVTSRGAPSCGSVQSSWEDLARYFQGLGPPPKFRVTLNFWEESPDRSHTPKSLITVQMEQAFARHLLEETPEEQAAILSLVQSLGSPPSSSPLCSPVSFERDSFSTLATGLPQC
ncbi:interferon regulatory factor 9 isoform X6 [Equus przewalskii]|uniref:Interferon regulatory factor 9 isoform X6 n=1 Tax=Equus przewalskii TaxID=9798 RepID=A0ABM4Q288_EQUPR